MKYGKRVECFPFNFFLEKCAGEDILKLKWVFCQVVLFNMAALRNCLSDIITDDNTLMANRLELYCDDAFLF